MAFVLADRVRETTTTAGTGAVFLNGAVSGFQSFSAAIGNLNQTYYAIADVNTGAWEVGVGSYTSVGNILSRDTVLSSSNGGSLVNFSSFAKDVFVTQPASRAVFVQDGGTGLQAGTTAFTANGIVFADATNTSSTSANLTFNGTTFSAPNSVISSASSTDALRITQTGAGNALVVEDSANPDSTPFVVDSTGSVIVGFTAPVTTRSGTAAITPVTQIVGVSAGTSGFLQARYSADVNGPVQFFSKSRNSSRGQETVVQDGDALGAVSFGGSDGTQVTEAARVSVAVDGTPGLNDMPGRLVFSTTADGGTVPTERMRIDSAGTSTFTGQAIINASGTSDGLRITQTGTGNALVVEDSTNPDSTPFVVDASGLVIVGTTSPLITANDNGAAAAKVSAAGGTTSSFAALGANSTTARFTSSLTLKRTRGAESAPTTVVANDYLGRLDFQGHDGTSYIDAALIHAAVDGTPGLNDMPGRMVFSTTADGASTPTERMRITSAGKTGFATSAPAATVHVAGDTILSNVNVLGASYDGISFSVAAQETSPTDIFFSPDGKKMFIVGTVGDDVNEYALSTPWDVSSATFTALFSVAAQDTAPGGIFFRADGLKMYVLGTANDAVFQYTLGTAWDITTASYDTVSFSVAVQEITPNGLFFRPDGLSMYVAGSNADAIHQYTLSTAWVVSSAVFLQSFSVVSQESVPTGVFFTGDGSRMFVVGSTGDDVNVYNLTTPWDVSTAVFVNVFSVAGQDTSPQGLYIKPDGTKMYIVGTTNDTIYQYTVPSIDIELTGPTSVNGGLAVQQDLTVYGRIGVGTATPSVSLAVSASDAMLIPKGTTANRPAGISGYLRFNTTSNEFEGHNGTAWASVGGAAISNDISTATSVYPLFANATSGTASTVYTSNAKLLYKPSTGELSVTAPRASNGIVINNQTIGENYTIASGDNGGSFGPVTVASGITVTVSSGSVWTVT